jgi:hypothetical protein
MNKRAKPRRLPTDVEIITSSLIGVGVFDDDNQGKIWVLRGVSERVIQLVESGEDVRVDLIMTFLDEMTHAIHQTLIAMAGQVGGRTEAENLSQETESLQSENETLRVMLGLESGD